MTNQPTPRRTIALKPEETRYLVGLNWALMMAQINKQNMEPK